MGTIEPKKTMKLLPPHKIERVKPLPNNRLMIFFADGLIGETDITAFIAEHTILHPLKQPNVFTNVQLGEWGFDVTWDNGGDLTIPATVLRRITETQIGNPVQIFNQWMQRHDLTLTTAAESLGMTKRMIAYYRAGTKAIPKTVLLACLGWDYLTSSH